MPAPLDTVQLAVPGGSASSTAPGSWTVLSPARMAAKDCPSPSPGLDADCSARPAACQGWLGTLGLREAAAPAQTPEEAELCQLALPRRPNRHLQRPPRAQLEPPCLQQGQGQTRLLWQTGRQQPSRSAAISNSGRPGFQTTLPAGRQATEAAAAPGSNPLERRASSCASTAVFSRARQLFSCSSTAVFMRPHRCFVRQHRRFCAAAQLFPWSCQSWQMRHAGRSRGARLSRTQSPTAAELWALLRHFLPAARPARP